VNSAPAGTGTRSVTPVSVSIRSAWPARRGAHQGIHDADGHPDAVLGRLAESGHHRCVALDTEDVGQRHGQAALDDRPEPRGTVEVMWTVPPVAGRASDDTAAHRRAQAGARVAMSSRSTTTGTGRTRRVGLGGDLDAVPVRGREGDGHPEVDRHGQGEPPVVVVWSPMRFTRPGPVPVLVVPSRCAVTARPPTRGGPDGRPANGGHATGV